MARRARTNTPLQALVLMNDPTYLEAARKLAERVIIEGGTTSDSRITHAYLLGLARTPSAAELKVLQTTLQQRLKRYHADVDAAKGLITIGDSPRLTSASDAELAAWTSIMSMILNLDEVITKG